MKEVFYIKPDWKWGTAEGSRELDRLMDRHLTFREKIEWLEEAETLTLQLRKAREEKQEQGKVRQEEAEKTEAAERTRKTKHA